jgi:phosphoenolpyruvate carboxylase
MTIQKDSLWNLVNDYYQTKTKIEYYQQTLSAEKPLNEILGLIEEKKTKNSEKVKLDNLIEEIRQIRLRIIKQQRLSKLEQPVSEILEMIERQNRLVEQRKGTFTVISNVKSINDRIAKGNAYVALKEVEFKNAMGKVCLLCGQKIE